MKLLLTVRDQDVDPKLPEFDTANFRVRNAVRAVVLDAKNEILIVHVRLYQYHKLPGGGVEEGEDPAEALQRELQEEIGYRAAVMSELGQVIEYRGWEKLKQVSDCFLARQIGEQHTLSLDQYERDWGFEPVKASSIDDAIRIFEQDKPKNFEGEFIRRRDLRFLRAAKLQLSTRTRS